jgi:zinc finger protein
MHLIEIPHFREVIIMATTCDYCGYKSNEVKSSGAVALRGRRITLKLTSEEDLNRDILKSETCTLEIPEIDLHLTTGALGGRFTTLEGLLKQVRKELNDKVPFISGDSAMPEKKSAFDVVLKNIDKICQLELPCTVILDDPMGNSYLQNIFAPDEDPMMTVEEYERSFEQNEELGLNDMKVEGYE